MDVADESRPMWGPREERTSRKGYVGRNFEAQSDISGSLKVYAPREPNIRYQALGVYQTKTRRKIMAVRPVALARAFVAGGA